MSAEFLIMTPLLGALVLWLTHSRWPLPVLLAVGLANLNSGLGLAGELRQQRGPFRIILGGWEAPLGIHLIVDGLTVFMVLLTCVLAVLGGCYTLSEKRSTISPLFWPLWMAAWTGLNGVFLSGDLFNIYVMLEVVAMSSIALMTVAGKLRAQTAALRYLLAALVGSLTYLMGVAFLYAEHGMLDYLSLAAVVKPGARTNAGFALITVGLLLKTPLFPLHGWLPAAYSNSPPQVSALLSAIVGKASYYVLLRVWFQGCPTVPTVALGNLLGVLGSLAIIWCSILALRQRNLKRLIAYSSAAQLGYLFLVFPLSTATSAPSGWLTQAYTGAVYQLVAHGLAKSAMFLAAGVAVRSFGTELLPELRGLAYRHPLTAFTLAASGATLMGLPPSGGFAAKWLLLNGSLAAGQWWWALVLLGGGLLAAAYVFGMLRFAFEKVEESAPVAESHRGTEWAAFSLALGSIALGLWLEEPMQLLVVGGIGVSL